MFKYKHTNSGKYKSYLIAFFNLFIVCLILNLQLFKVDQMKSLGQFLLIIKQIH